MAQREKNDDDGDDEREEEDGETDDDEQVGALHAGSRPPLRRRRQRVVDVDVERDGGGQRRAAVVGDDHQEAVQSAAVGRRQGAPQHHHAELRVHVERFRVAGEREPQRRVAAAVGVVRLDARHHLPAAGAARHVDGGIMLVGEVDDRRVVVAVGDAHRDVGGADRHVAVVARQHADHVHVTRLRVERRRGGDDARTPVDGEQRPIDAGGDVERVRDVIVRRGIPVDGEHHADGRARRLVFGRVERVSGVREDGVVVVDVDDGDGEGDGDGAGGLALVGRHHAERVPPPALVVEGDARAHHARNGVDVQPVLALAARRAQPVRHRRIIALVGVGGRDARHVRAARRVLVDARRVRRLAELRTVVVDVRNEHADWLDGRLRRRPAVATNHRQVVDATRGAVETARRRHQLVPARGAA